MYEFRTTLCLGLAGGQNLHGIRWGMTLICAWIGYRKLVLARSGTTKCFGFLVGYKAMLATSSQFIHVSCFLAAKHDDSMDIEKR